jgi:hypothetical protein
MILNLTVYFQNIHFILSLAFYILVILAGAEKENAHIKYSYLLICYGGIGIASPFIENFLFFFAPTSILSGILSSGVLLIAVLFLLTYSLKNYKIFGRPLLITSIFLLIEYFFDLIFNITISFFDFTSLIRFIQVLIMDSILIIPMVFLIIHGKRNDDNYLKIAGILQIGIYIFMIITNLILGIPY